VVSAGENCLLCAVAGGGEPDGGWLIRTELVSGYLSGANRQLPGWCQLQVNRHATHLGALTAAEAAAVGVAAQALGAAITAVTGGDRVYAYSICEASPHFHLVLGPPPAVGPADQRGPALLARVLARDPTLGDPAAAASVAARLRAALELAPDHRPAPR
jgi:diadenosine tetraphosphate (Ap4A) HIT family hydrolase